MTYPIGLVMALAIIARAVAMSTGKITINDLDNDSKDGILDGRWKESEND